MKGKILLTSPLFFFILLIFQGCGSKTENYNCEPGKFPVRNKPANKNPDALRVFCDLAGARTQDPILKRDVLYQLSY